MIHESFLSKRVGNVSYAILYLIIVCGSFKFYFRFFPRFSSLFEDHRSSFGFALYKMMHQQASIKREPAGKRTKEGRKEGKIERRTNRNSSSKQRGGSRHRVPRIEPVDLVVRLLGQASPDDHVTKLEPLPNTRTRILLSLPLAVANAGSYYSGNPHDTSTRIAINLFYKSFLSLLQTVYQTIDIL